MTRWVVTLDGEVDMEFSSRAEARAHAAWLRRHPDVIARAERADERSRAIGEVMVLDREAPPEWACDARGCLTPAVEDGYCSAHLVVG